MTPRVSVVVQTYNHERYIAAALDGVLGQRTEFDVEVIVTEDCSTDATRSIVSGYLNRFPERISCLFSDRNLNDNTVFTRALDAVRGEFVANLDGDDFWTDPDKLQRQVDHLDRHPECALCFHDVLTIHESGRRPYRYASWDIPSRTGIENLLVGNYIQNASAVVRRAAIEPRPAWYDEEEIQDWALWILAALSGEIHYIDDILSVYRTHSGNWWINRSDQAILEENIRFLDQLEPHLPAHGEALNDARARYRRELAERLARRSDEALRETGGAATPLSSSAPDNEERRRTDMTAFRQSPDEIDIAISRIDDAVIALLHERENLIAMLGRAPSRDKSFISVDTGTPFREPFALRSRHRAIAYDKLVSGLWIGFDRDGPAHVEIGQEPKIVDRLSPEDYRFVLDVAVVDSGESGWITLEWAVGELSRLSGPVRVTVVLCARADAARNVQIELALIDAAGTDTRTPLGRAALNEMFSTSVLTGLVLPAPANGLQAARPPALIMFLPKDAGATVTLAYCGVFLSPAGDGPRP